MKHLVIRYGVVSGEMDYNWMDVLFVFIAAQAVVALVYFLTPEFKKTNPPKKRKK
ncbi:MAG: hypothetical protein RR051_07795 [Clostridiales bacterium]